MTFLEEIREVLRYEPDTGLFFWTDKGKKHKHSVEITSQDKDNYLIISHKQKQYKAHRLAWLLTHGEWPDVIDHIDLNPSNNKLSNLRNVGKSINGHNIFEARKDNKIGIRGVSAKRNKWRAVINHHGKQKSLGSFNTIEEAQEAYLVAKKNLISLS